MQNIVYAIYFVVIAIVILYGSPFISYLAGKLGYSQKIITTKKTYFFLLTIFAILVGIKIFHLSQSSNLIQNELLAPVFLSNSGESLLKNFSTDNKPNEIINAYEKLNSSKSGLEFANNKIALENLRYLNALGSLDNLEKWVLENKLLVGEAALWRGRVIHHYSTILFPLREIKEGGLGYLLTSQYGLVSFLPLLFVSNVPFIVYGVASLLCLLIGGIYILYRTKNSASNNLIAGGLLISLIVFTNLAAVRISPGFSFLRYLPIAILLYQLSKLLSNKNEVKYYVFFLLAILNSIQFNILFLLIAGTTYVLIGLQNKNIWLPKIFKATVPVFFIVALQIIIFSYQKSPFTPSLFSSVGESSFSILYACSILLFPVAALVMNTAKARLNIESSGVTREQIIFACIAYGLCSSYAISFVKSPQHYVGFIAMAFIAIYIFLKDSLNSRFAAIVLVILLLFPAFHFKYFDLGKRPKQTLSDLYVYSDVIGAQLNFRTALNVGSLSETYHILSKKYESAGKIFFISKDKIFIELFNDKNIEPKVYDVFTNFINIDSASAISKLKEGGADYVVMDNQNLLNYSMQAIKMSEGTVGKEEWAAYIRIMNNMQDLSKQLEKNLLECNSRYCIYKI